MAKSDISKTRAERIARNDEIIKAHAEEQLDALELLGLDEEEVLIVEWLVLQRNLFRATLIYIPYYDSKN